MSMRTILSWVFFFGILCLSATAEPAMQIRVLAKETHGLFYLLESLRGEAHHSQHLARVFWSLHPRTESDSRALEAFQRLLNNPEWTGVTLPGVGKRRRLSDVLEVLSLQARNSEDLLERSQAFLTLQDHAELTHAVRHFAPLYHALIWEKGRAELQRQSQELEEALKKAGMGERMAEARRFYASQWPAERAFWVALVPIPHKPGEVIHTYGHSDSFLEVIEVPSGTPVSRHSGVVFHELCHSLWATMPAQRQQELRQDFYALGHPGRCAYDQLNEALATALGNGWFQGLVDAKPPGAPWYADDIIDEYARALYPLVLKALHNPDVGLDKAFVNAAVRLFSERFPRYAEDINVVFREIVIVSSLPLVHRGDFQGRLSTLRFARSIYVTSDVGGDSSRRMLEQHPHASRLFFLRPEQRRQVQELYDFPSLPEAGLYVLHKNSVWYVAVVGTSSEEYVSLLSQLAKKRYLQPSRLGPNP